MILVLFRAIRSNRAKFFGLQFQLIVKGMTFYRKFRFVELLIILILSRIVILFIAIEITAWI